MMAPPNSELPFINVIFLRTTSEAVILNILDFFKPLIVKPLPSMVNALLICIPSLKLMLSLYGLSEAKSQSGLKVIL